MRKLVDLMIVLISVCLLMIVVDLARAGLL